MSAVVLSYVNFNWESCDPHEAMRASGVSTWTVAWSPGGGCGRWLHRVRRCPYKIIYTSRNFTIVDPSKKKYDDPSRTVRRLGEQ